jgi:type I restriction enzyme S subunit
MAWQNKTLGEICKLSKGFVRTGPFGTQLHQSDYSENGTPVIMPKDIIDGKVSVESIARVEDDIIEGLSQHKLKTGDIVYGRRGDIGRRALVTELENGWLCGTGCIRVNLGEGVIDPFYLYYYLGQSLIIDWMKNQAIGATMPNLNASIIERIPVSYPPLPIQRKIADMLSAYDDLIEVNTRRIRNLEQMAQAVYHEWFGKVEAKSLPEGWKLMKVGDAIELPYGKGLKADTRIEGKVPVFGSGGLVGYHNQSLVKGPGIIVGRKGNVGSLFWSDDDFYPIDTVFYVQTNISLYYVFYNLHTQNFINNDAAVPGLNRNQAYSLPFLLPPKSMLDKFDQFVAPIFQQTRILRNQNANLRRTRDLLLPRLVSGEVGL